MTPKPCAVVADSHVHARAMIRWMELDKEIWIPVHYGQVLRADYLAALIIRPLGGIGLGHLAWLEVDLFPRVSADKFTVPNTWVPDQGADTRDALGFSSMWTR